MSMTLLAYLVASFCVALLWAGYMALWEGRSTDLLSFLRVVGLLTPLVAAYALIPTLLALALAYRTGAVTLPVAALAGLVTGAGLFLLLFGKWMPDDPFSDQIEIAAGGGALGLVGGLTFQLTRTALLRRVRA